MKSKNVCPCGLNCNDCLFYKKEVYETAQKLRELIKTSQLDIFLTILSEKESYNAMARHLGEEEREFKENFDRFKKMPEFLSVLEGIINIQCKQTCQEAGGCSMCGKTKECEAIKCVKEKNYKGCWECLENSNCNKLSFQKVCYGKTIEGNFKIIEEDGIDSVPSRGNDYYEWQRRINKL